MKAHAQHTHNTRNTHAQHAQHTRATHTRNTRTAHAQHTQHTRNTHAQHTHSTRTAHATHTQQHTHSTRTAHAQHTHTHSTHAHNTHAETHTKTHNTHTYHSILGPLSLGTHRMTPERPKVHFGWSTALNKDHTSTRRPQRAKEGEICGGNRTKPNFLDPFPPSPERWTFSSGMGFKNSDFNFPFFKKFLLFVFLFVSLCFFFCF